MKRLLRWLFGTPYRPVRAPILNHQPCGHPLAARAVRGAVTVCWACDCAAEERAR